jgi:Zn-dependent protease
MRHLYYVLTIRGMPVRLHYTWAIVGLLGIPVLSGMLIPAALPTVGGFARVLLALLILALFFGTVLVHEVAHLFVARLFRVRYSALNLYPLGALTRRSNRQSDARTLFCIAAAGPVVSIGLGWVLMIIAAGTFLPIWLAVMLKITGALSLYLGLINLLPAYPLDGGRMLQAVIWMAQRWWLSGDFTTATGLARIVGQLSAYGVMLIGVIMLMSGQAWLLPGTLILIGWAILEAGGTLRRRMLATELLGKLTANDVLVAPSRTTEPARSLSEFARILRGNTDDEPVPVIANGVFLGMIGRAQLDVVANGYWDRRTVGETMVPAADLDLIEPTTPVSRLISRLADTESGRDTVLPVVQDGHLLGLIKAEEMMTFLNLDDSFGLVPHGTVEDVSPAKAAMSA